MARGAPVSSRAFLEQAIAKLLAKDHAAAEALVQQVLASYPDDFDAWPILGRIRAAANDHPGALGCFDEALRRSRHSARAWANRAEALSQLGRPAEAVGSFDAALALDPSRVEWW
jgi:predicted Zn-dependent protease